MEHKSNENPLRLSLKRKQLIAIEINWRVNPSLKIQDFYDKKWAKKFNTNELIDRKLVEDFLQKLNNGEINDAMMVSINDDNNVIASSSSESNSNANHNDGSDNKEIDNVNGDNDNDYLPPTNENNKKRTKTEANKQNKRCKRNVDKEVIDENVNCQEQPEPITTEKTAPKRGKKEVKIDPKINADENKQQPQQPQQTNEIRKPRKCTMASNNANQVVTIVGKNKKLNNKQQSKIETSETNDEMINNGDVPKAKDSPPPPPTVAATTTTTGNRRGRKPKN